MNIIKFEFKNNLKFILAWTLAIIVVTGVFISFYPLVSNDIDSFAEIMKNYPAAIQKMFGFNPDLLTDILGYYSSFAFTFVLLFSAICASILGFSILSKDLINKSAEFLYAKPIKRSMIVIYKALSGLLLIMFLNMFVLLINYSMLSMIGSFDMLSYLLVTLVIFFIQVSFYSISLFISHFMKVKSSIATGLGVTFMFYIGGVALSNDFRAVIPFKYFNMLDIINNKTYDLFYVLLVFMLFLVSVITGILVYNKKDL